MLILQNHDLEEIPRGDWTHQTYIGKDRISGKEVFGKPLSYLKHDDPQRAVNNIQLVDNAARILDLPGPKLLSVEKNRLPKEHHSVIIHELEREAKPLSFYSGSAYDDKLSKANQKNLLDVFLMEKRLGVSDRHSGNYLLHPNGNIFSIDHEGLKTGGWSALEEYLDKVNGPLDFGVINKHIKKTKALQKLIKGHNTYNSNPRLKENFANWTNRLYKVSDMKDPRFRDLYV